MHVGSIATTPPKKVGKRNNTKNNNDDYGFKKSIRERMNDIIF